MKSSRNPAPPVFRSGLYECRVLHHRYAPREHRFVYRLFYFALDLDELDALGGASRLFSTGKSALFSFRDRDFLPVDEPVYNPTRTTTVPARASLKTRVLAFCLSRGVDLPAETRVLLVTLPRVLGYRFSPVSFYFCQDADGTPRAAIAEVTNTFREVKPYLVPFAGPSGLEGGVFRSLAPKHFYVSPFSSLDSEFDFTLRAPAGRLAIRIDNKEHGRLVLHSTLTGRRLPFSDRRLLGLLLKYPFVTLGVVLRIHWQALRLWLKRVPFFRKAAAAPAQRDLHRPHSSLTTPTL